MCDSATLSLIDEEVDRKVQSGLMFTAFDVTLAVQEALKKQGSFDPNNHRHRHLKNDVHRAIDAAVTAGQYSRNLQDVGAPSAAYVYYPVGGDPSQYVPLSRNDGQSADPYAIPVSAPKAAAVAVAADDDGDGSDVGRGVDARGSLTVPAFMLRQIGFKSGETAYVVEQDDNGKQVLAVQRSTPASGQLATYTVDHNVNVRLTQATLAHAYPNVRAFDFELVNSCVVVREHSDN